MRRTRLGLLLVVIAIVATSTACQVTIGCTTYSWGFPTGLMIDSSACGNEPPPVIPEAPLTWLLPVVAAGAGALVLSRRARRNRLG